ncbi:hypothetical protein Tco_0624853 [Tanacetum coccineum]|uniref:Uncharacterized protein n=1 Tax=Tanacetum coccineum TaxID=301880 RepID=A0ABQ4WF39_9ASTR
MGRDTWYYSLGVSSIVDEFVRSEFGISSWRGSRVDGRSYLLSGAIDGSKANRIIRDSKLEFKNSRFMRKRTKEDARSRRSTKEDGLRLCDIFVAYELLDILQELQGEGCSNGNSLWEASVLLGRKKGG